MGILANKEEDLVKYGDTKGSRFKYVLMIARCWFKIIKDLERMNMSIAKLQTALSSKTLIGEYVGHKNLQHIMKYRKETIVFYAITDNTDNEKN